MSGTNYQMTEDTNTYTAVYPWLENLSQNLFAVTSTNVRMWFVIRRPPAELGCMSEHRTVKQCSRKPDASSLHTFLFLQLGVKCSERNEMRYTHAPVAVMWGKDTEQSTKCETLGGMCENNRLFWIDMSTELTVWIYVLYALVGNVMRTVRCVSVFTVRDCCIQSGTWFGGLRFYGSICTIVATGQ